MATESTNGFYNLTPTYPGSYNSALSFITPFTHRTNISYSDMLFELYKWLRETHLPELDKILEDFKAEYLSDLDTIRDDIQKTKDDWQIIYNEFVQNITDLVASINNRVGNVDVQHILLISDSVVELNPMWPNNHVLNYEVTQDSVGEHTLTMGTGITGDVIINPDAGGVTRFSLWPNGDGTFYTVQVEPTFHTTFYGHEAFDNGKYNQRASRNNEAFGKRALYNLKKGRYNVAIGLESGFTVDGTGFSESQLQGTRNTMVGSNSGRFITNGYNNVAIGRNALQCGYNVDNLVAIGAGALSGYAHVGYDGNIQLILKNKPVQNIGIGTNALFRSQGVDNTMVGIYAGQNIKNLHNNTGFGRNALANLDADSHEDGKVRHDLNTSAGLTIVDGVMTIKLAGHPFEVGSLIYYTHTGYESQYYFVESVVDADTVILESPYDATIQLATSTINIVSYTIPGDDFGRSRGWNTAVGTFALSNLRGSVYGNNESGLNTAIGYRALQETVDGSLAHELWQNVGLGAATKSSGTNQVILGNESTTPYAYQPMQVRSDERDKADIQDTPLGLEFVNKLRPVQYRWDRRDSYVEENRELGREFGYRDGTHKGTRLHNGLIAQELKSVSDEMGIDFAGYQDHTVNGGSDVMTVAYEELISPMIKAIQELSAENASLRDRITNLESM